MATGMGNWSVTPQQAMQMANAPMWQYSTTTGTSDEPDSLTKINIAEEMKTLKKEMELEFADLHLKIDKMSKILLQLVNPDIAIPGDAIREMIGADS